MTIPAPSEPVISLPGGPGATTQEGTTAGGVLGQPPSLGIPSIQLPALILPGTLGTASSGRLQLIPSLTLSEEYTDNFNLTPTNKRGNLRTTVAPGLSLTLNGARLKGNVSYTLSAYYDSLLGDIGYFNSLLGQVTYQVTPLLSLTAYDVLTQGDEPNQADRLGLRRDRGRFTSNVFSLSADYLLAGVATRAYYLLSMFFDEAGDDTQTNQFGASATTTLASNTVSAGYEYLNTNTTETVDVSGHRFTGSVSRRLSPRFAGGMAGSYSIRDESGGDTSQAASDYTLWSVAAFGTYDVPGRLTVAGSIGYGRARARSGTTVPEIPATLSVTYRFAKAVATVGFESGFSETFDLGQNFGVVKTFGLNASLTYPFTPLLLGSASGFYRKNEATDVGESGGLSDTDNYWGGALSLSYQLRSWLGLRLDYYYTRWGSRAGNDYAENRGRAALSASF